MDPFATRPIMFPDIAPMSREDLANCAEAVAQPDFSGVCPGSPTIQRATESGLRYDGGKSRIDLIPPEFIEALGAHFGVGARKYAEHNWCKGMSWSRCYACAQRHMLAFWRGEDVDEETGTPHVICAAWNMAALHWYAVHKIGVDDRYLPGGAK